MHLQHLIQDLSLLAVHGEAKEQWVEGIAFDSRKVKQDYLFVAIKGTQVDGHDFIETALQAGATVIVGERPLADLQLPQAVVETVAYLQVDANSGALGILANRWYDEPSRHLKLVGITGTNGKTTVATLLHDLFTELGYKAGLLSTVEVRIGKEKRSATHTTPDALAINAHLAEMLAFGTDFVFMEVSSHAVAQKRIAGLQFTGGVFTNMSHDHLDYHQTFKAYIEAKKAFFDALPNSAFALVNIDDKRGEVMLQNTAAKQQRYSLRQLADFRAKVLENSAQGLHLTVNEQEVYTQLLGRFNAYNLLAAYGTAILLNQDPLESLTGLSKLRAAAGRLDYLADPQGGRIGVVDYAHTPDALQNALETLRAVIPNGHQLICVVGAGGDRDRRKRPEMARIGARLADRLILTSDNPRSESPEAILDDMEAGLAPEAKAKALRITDRRSAIRTAVSLANAGDLVLIAGKGHENYQEIKGERIPFDDKIELQKAFNQLN